ncbi:MAG TPA: UDP-N-acetylglucosamine 1-carboxyvinyltransferase [Erysipelothrix sp.]|nr:UDP-N-acetylglucosamine 1-carboxyvinyltransferase [Erysipelothrix sp.]
MADVIKIEGQHELNGTIRVSGSKNATVALIPAAVLSSNGKVTIYGVPEIDDVENLRVLLKELNVSVEQTDDMLEIDSSNLINIDLESNAVTKLRASYYLMGALLGRFKRVRMKMPGGCYLGPRPIDLHLKGFESLGAKVTYDHLGYLIEAEELTGAKIYLDFASVGATINIMFAAVLANGRTTIENAAKEPEIIDVATMLNKMGAKIRGAGTSVITIDGVEKLVGCVHEIIPDRIVAGTYLIIAAAMGREVRIDNIIPHHLEALISKLSEMGVKTEVGVDHVVVTKAENLKGVDISTQPYPGFATDLQQPLTSLLTQAIGSSVVKESIYTERFKHCIELQRMGADIRLSTAQCTVEGPTPLYGDTVTATDLRCGASLIVAGLLAKGVTTIRETYHIDRGYEHIDEKLQAIGAKIWREAE